MAAFWRQVLLAGTLGVVLTAAFPDNRDRRQAEPPPPVGVEEEAGEAEGEEEPNPLGLPANASSLLPGGGPPDDSFSCEDRGYGYYADPANACRVFHVCLPLKLPSSPPDAPPEAHRFSFICPEQTLFNQEAFTCTRPEDSIPCEESPQWYHLNERLGRTEIPTVASNDVAAETNAL